jgi:dolichol-phosphate mannosyltransferase
MAIGISVVVPVKDEAENVAPLAHEIAAALAGETSGEIIFVDDGSANRSQVRAAPLVFALVLAERADSAKRQ